MVCRRILVRGRVQGVGFRAWTARQAQDIGGISGWVRNLENGDVEALAQGEEESVARFIEACRQGPPASVVSGVETRDEPPMPDLHGFQVRG